MQFTLQELIAWLESRDPQERPVIGLGFAHSYRGYYDQLAFEPHVRVPVWQSLNYARDAVGATHRGWKGGDYLMRADTPVWLATSGDTGVPLTEALLTQLYSLTTED